MTEFVLVRHGETDWNTAGRLQGSRDIPLNDNGVLQAKALAAALQHGEWDVVLSSPLKRAFDTAAQIVEPLGFVTSDIVIDPRLRERRYGAAEGFTVAERQERWPDDVWPEAETHQALDVRTGPVMEELAETYAGKRVVVVTHGGWIRSVLRVLSGYDPTITETAIPNVSCSYVSHYGDGWELGELGVAEHVQILD